MRYISTMTLILLMSSFALGACGGGGSGGSGLGLLFFPGNDGTGGATENYELWSWDGNAASKVAEINSSTAGSNPRDFISHGDLVLFNADDGIHGSELWATDGSTAWMVTDTYPGLTSGSPRHFTRYGGEIYFTSNYNAGFVAYGLFATDGTAAGTRQVIRYVTPYFIEDINDVTVFGGNIVISAYADSPGSEGLFATNGVADSLTTIIDGFISSREMAVMGNTLYFNAADSTRSTELWATDGTAAGTTLVLDINPSGFSNPSDLTPLDGTLYFTAQTPSYGKELWASDGTAAGTTLVLDIRPGVIGSDLWYLTAFDGSLYFPAGDSDVNGNELWKMEPMGAPFLFAHINTQPNTSSNPYGFTKYRGDLYFFAVDPVNGSEMWVTDGTPAGTRIVVDLNPGTGNGVAPD